MTDPIKEVIEALDKNIQNILGSKEFTLEDARMILIKVLGIIKEMWDTLGGVLEKADDLKEFFKKFEGKEGKEEEKIVIDDVDIERLYQ